MHLQTEESSNKAKNKRSHLLLKSLIGLFLFLFIVGILFIKFNTSAAAQFTDNYLRPLIGNQAVVFIEKIYFNVSDKINQVTFNGKVVAPDFFGIDGIVHGGSGNLNLSNININNGFKPLSGEGVWHNRPLKIFPNREVIAYTFVRPDPSRPYVVVTLAQMNMAVLNLGVVAGTKQPGGPIGRPGPGVVPSSIVSSGGLVAAFNGGFQYRDGMYGMVVGGNTYLPLKNDIGTIVGFKDGSLRIIKYRGQILGKDVVFARQNCPILIENGEISILNDMDKKLWGRTPTTDIYTWRTGIGLTKDGNLVYAVGNALTPLTLSYALKAAGAVDAIQLDINPFWVRFNIFEPDGVGGYTSKTLTKDLKDGSKQYLSGYEKDFFYLYKKPGI